MSKRGKGFQVKVGSFFQQYQRKAHAGWDPNDRGYDRDVEKKIKAMDPEELSRLMHDDLETDIPREVEDCWFSGQETPGILFHLHDSVSVKAGQHVGEAGSVIALLRLTPEPEYLVELGSGVGDIKVFQSKLDLLTD